MESPHFQATANAKPLDTSIRKPNHSTNVGNISSIANNSINSTTLVNNTNAQSTNAGIAGGGANEQSNITTPTIITNQKLTNVQNSITSSTLTSTANQIITSSPAVSQGTPNGQATPVQQQQIIQVSSQAGSIVPGQQLMVQTLSGRPAIQLRTQGGQQFQQIQLIPFSNLQGQTQRPVIIQQTPGNVLHSASGTITSMANLATHNNVAKLNSTSLNNSSSTLSNSNNLTSSAANLAHQKPVIIQQATGSNQFIHSSTAQTHGIHHNVTKIATIGRSTTANRPQQTAGATSNKMVLGHLTTGLTNSNNSSNHQVQQSNAATVASLSNNSNSTAAVVNSANPQQVTRLNIISSLPSVHTSVSNVAHSQHSGTNKPILSLAALGNKPLIINPASNVQNVQPSTIVGNVVNMSNLSNFANTHQLKQGNASTNIIPTVMTLTTLTTSSNSIPGRHTMITSSTNHSQLNNSNTNANNLNLTQINSSAHNPQTLQQQPNQTTLTNHQSSATMRSNLLNPSTGSSIANSSLNSPIKQIPQQTPSSPRPSILIR